MTDRLPLNTELIESRLSLIEESLESLKRFRSKSLEEYQSNPDNFRICYYDLYVALESSLDIGTHILSRIPGARPASYKEVPLMLQRYNILPEEFIKNTFMKMAGYRNRIIHFYHKLSSEEIYQIIQNHLDDFTRFTSYIKEILKDPSRHGFPSPNTQS